MPGEQRQEVLGRRRSGRGEYAGKVSEKTHDFIGIFMLVAKEAEVERLVSLAEALTVFVYEKGMMILKRRKNVRVKR